MTAMVPVVCVCVRSTRRCGQCNFLLGVAGLRDIALGAQIRSAYLVRLCYEILHSVRRLSQCSWFGCVVRDARYNILNVQIMSAYLVWLWYQ